MIKGERGQILIPVRLFRALRQSMFNVLAPVRVSVSVFECVCLCECVWVNISCELLHMLMFWLAIFHFQLDFNFLCFCPSPARRSTRHRRLCLGCVPERDSIRRRKLQTTRPPYDDGDDGVAVSVAAAILLYISFLNNLTL